MRITREMEMAVVARLYKRGWRVVRIREQGGYVMGGSYVNPQQVVTYEMKPYLKELP